MRFDGQHSLNGPVRATAAGTIGVPDDYDHVQASPAAFGADVGQAEQQAGGALQQAGGTALAIATTDQTLQDHAAVTRAVARKKNADRARLLTGNRSDPSAPQPYYGLKGADAVSAYHGTVSDLQSSNDSIRARGIAYGVRC